MTQQFALSQIQRVKNGSLLAQADCDFANKLLSRGEQAETVWSLIRGWADEYARVSSCEGAAANQFHDMAYGR